MPAAFNHFQRECKSCGPVRAWRREMKGQVNPWLHFLSWLCSNSNFVEACADPGGAALLGQTAGCAPTRASLTDFKTLFLTAQVTDLFLKLPVMKWRTQNHLIVEHIKGSIFKIKKIGQTVESITIFKGIYRAVVDESFGIVSLSQCLNWFLHCTVFSFKMCASLNNYIHIKNQHFFAST